MSSHDWFQVREQTLARYFELLAAADSPLLSAGAAAREQLRSQLLGVVDAVYGELLGEGDHPETGDAGTRLSESIGRTRATARIHPSQSLRAASLIFEAALPAISEQLRRAGVGDPGSTAAIALNAEILRRMSTAATGYVDYLLDKAQSSNRDERRRLSRELHDVAAPAVAIGLQNLELYEVYAGSDAGRAADKIDAARQSLINALVTLRNLSAQSRESVAANGLAQAVQQYLDTLPPDISTRLRTKGPLAAVPLSYAEELFLILREAVRNAVDHGKPTRISLTIGVDEVGLRARVRDDGIGFDVKKLHTIAHVGIDAMHERADLLDADLEISSRPGRGTTVTVSVSLPPGLGQRDEIRR